MAIFVFAALLFASLIGRVAAAESANVPAGYQLLYEQKFTGPKDLRDFAMSDTNAWRITKTNDVIALDLVEQSKYKPQHRSPFNIALIADKVFTDFVVEADLMQTGKEYGHRDMCIFYGFEDPSHFYYTHIATAADEHAHNTFIVKDAPRTKIAKQTTKGVNWGLGIWHKMRLERKGSDGTIKVFFDDMTNPIMLAQDTTFRAGYVGFGSFDDTGMIDNIRIWAPAAEIKKTEFFQRASQ